LTTAATRGLIRYDWWLWILCVIVAVAATAACAPDPERLGADCAAGNERACERLVEIAEDDLAPWVKSSTGERPADELAREQLDHIRDASLRDQVEQVSRLTDEDVLAKLARDSRAWPVHVAAVNRLGKLGAEMVPPDYSEFEKHPRQFLREHRRVVRLQVAPQSFPEEAVGLQVQEEIAGVMERLLGSARTVALVEGVVRIVLNGRALSATYGSHPYQTTGDVSYSGAQVDARVCFVLREEELYCREFAGRARPPEMVHFVQADPAKAPFDAATGDLAGGLVRFVIEELKDTEGLSEVAETASLLEAGREAMGSLRDQGLESQALLARIASNNEDKWMRQEALWRLTDEALLAEISGESKNAWARMDARKRLEEVRRHSAALAAVENLADQAALAEVAKNTRHWMVRRAAASKLTDQALLAEIVNPPQNFRVILAALGNLTNQAALADIARNAGTEEVRGAAVKRLANESVLAEIADEDQEERWVRETAKQRLRKLQGGRQATVLPP